MLGPPGQAHRAAALLERLCRGGLEVLLQGDELAAAVEIDDVAGDGAEVDDVADVAGLAIVLARADEPYLLGANGEPAAVTLEDVRRADEAGDELGRGPLVDLGRRADLLDPARG